MKGLTHQTFGAFCAAIAIHSGYIDSSMWVGVPIACLGALIPDVDHPQSKLGRRIYPVSVLLFQYLGHRGFIHSGAFWALLTGVLWLVNSTFSYLPQHAWMLFSLGHASHLVGDMLCGRKGVQLFWPYRPRQRIVPGTWSVGGLHEIILLSIFSASTAYLFGVTW